MTVVVDPLRVPALLDRLGQETGALHRLPGRDGLLADDDLLAGVKYRFVVAIETSIAVGRHTIASSDLRAPRDYADVFAVLAEGHVLPDDLAADLRDMARFRNPPGARVRRGRR